MIWTHAAAALAALAVGFAGGWQVQGWRWRAADADRLQMEARDAVRRAERADAAAAGHEATKERIRTEVRYITQEVDRAIAAAPDHLAGQCLDDAGLRLVTRALGAAGDPGQPAPAVPAASSPD